MTLGMTPATGMNSLIFQVQLSRRFVLISAVIFTKRATSIIGPNTPIYPHPKVTDTLDYEGELGIIVGKGGIGIRKENAWDHVWGAVIINDVSRR